MKYFKEICGQLTDEAGIKYIDLTKYINLKSNFSQTALMNYVVGDGETPESVAKKLYGDYDHWWIVCLFANINDRFYDWPMNDKVLNSYIDLLKSKGEISGTTAYQQAAVDVLKKENSQKRKIQVLSPRYISTFLYQLETFLSNQT